MGSKTKPPHFGKETPTQSAEDTATHSAFHDQPMARFAVRPDPTGSSHLLDVCPPSVLTTVHDVQIVVNTLDGELEVVLHTPDRTVYLASTPFGVRREVHFEEEPIEVSYVALKEPFRHQTKWNSPTDSPG